MIRELSEQEVKQVDGGGLSVHQSVTGAEIWTGATVASLTGTKMVPHFAFRPTASFSA